MHNCKFIVFVLLCAVMLLGLPCYPCQPVRDAHQVIAVADSLRVNEGATCDDSLALAEAYSTLGHWRLIYPDDYARACYYYGYLLRQHNNQVAAMQAFIAGSHAPYVDRVVPLLWFSDYHILGRIYTNMGMIAHASIDFAHSYDMYKISAEKFLCVHDTIAYFYAINAMAFEQAMLKDKDKTLALLGTIENNCADYEVRTKTLETKAELYLCMQQYDSAIYYADCLYANGNHEATGLLIKAQAYSYLSLKDSAVLYAQRVLVCSDDLFNRNNALYILANDDEAKDKKAALETSADRSDVQKLIVIRQGKLSQAMQLLGQDLHRLPDWRWYIALFLIVTCIIIAIAVVQVGKKRKLQMQERVSTLAATQANSIIESVKLHIDTTDLNTTLHWKDYASMKVSADLFMGGIVSKLEARHLNETEIRFCILTLLDIRLNQIAKIIHYAYPSGIKTLKKRTADKLGTSAPELKEYLLHLLPEA